MKDDKSKELAREEITANERQQQVQSGQEPFITSSVSGQKAPWGRGTLLIISFFAGFAAAGITAGINWRRMGKHNLAWPTIVGSVIIFFLFVYFLPETVSNSSASFISLAIAWGLWRWQKSYYHEWIESHPEAQKAGWQIPTITVLGSYAVIAAMIFMPILMIREATPTALPYSDDFSDPTSGWETFDNKDGSVSYEGGWLHVKNYTSTELNTVSWAYRSFTDFIFEVETKLVAGTDYNRHDIWVRCDDYGNGYLFCISTDGFFGICALAKGSVLSSPEADILVEDTSTYIVQGQGATNLVRVECVGSTLRLSVNGHLLGSVTDTRFNDGDIGLGAAAFQDSFTEETFTEVAFDNIVLNAP